MNDDALSGGISIARINKAYSISENKHLPNFADSSASLGRVEVGSCYQIVAKRMGAGVASCEDGHQAPLEKARRVKLCWRKSARRH